LSIDIRRVDEVIKIYTTVLLVSLVGAEGLKCQRILEQSLLKEAQILQEG